MGDDLHNLMGSGGGHMGRTLSTPVDADVHAEVLGRAASHDLSLVLPWLRELTEDITRTEQDYGVVRSALTGLQPLLNVGSDTSSMVPEKRPKPRKKKAKPRRKLLIYGKLMQLSAADLRKQADLHAVCPVRMMLCVEKSEIIAAILESAAQRSERVSCNMRQTPPTEAG